jgi:hypothetical protein
LNAPQGGKCRAGRQSCTNGKLSECLGLILPGEEIVLSKDTEDGRWVALHRRDRCEGLAGSAPGAPHVVRPDGPWGTLFLVPGAPPEVVKAVYRALAQLYHPDRGGDAARMAAVNAAVAELIK